MISMLINQTLYLLSSSPSPVSTFSSAGSVHSQPINRNQINEYYDSEHFLFLDFLYIINTFQGNNNKVMPYNKLFLPSHSTATSNPDCSHYRLLQLLSKGTLDYTLAARNLG